MAAKAEKAEAREISQAALERLDRDIERLRADTQLGPSEAEALLGQILEPLLEQENYDLTHTGGAGDGGIDFRAERSTGEADGEKERLGIQFKHYRQPGRRVSSASVRELIGAGLLNGFGRVMLVSSADFSAATREEVSRNLPLTVELLGISDLKGWAARLRPEKQDMEIEVRVLLRDLSQALIRLIASDVATLDHLEWRDVERVVAEVFSGLGFAAVLTPGSKDGGKDVVLTCTVNGARAQYYVEVKHWRSATRVGSAAVEQLLSVVVREQKAGGLFLSTYGYTENAFEQLTALDREKLRFGDKEKIVTLCRTWVKARAGLWSPPENLSQVLFSD